MTAPTCRLGRAGSWLAACVTGLWLAISALARPARASGDDVLIVVHPSSGVASAERALLSDVFLKKVTHWANGETTKPVDLRPGSPVRKHFSESVLRRSVGAVRSYWQQRIFSGRDVPPPELESEAAVVAFVARTPGAVGYVSGGTKLTGVRELTVR